MFDNELTWLYIAIAAVGITSSICFNKVDMEKEKTKQIEIQLKIEIIKAGITNAPVLIEKP